MNVDDALLHDAVARAFDVPALDRLEVERTPIDYDAFLPGRALSMLAGTAWTDGSPHQWSLVEKVTDPAPVAPPFIRDGGRRELEAYQSGVLDELGPGIVAPRAYGAAEEATGRVRLLLEVVVDERDAWETADWLRGARHLGQLGAATLDRARRPEPWMLLRWTDRHAQPEAMDEGRRIFAELGDEPDVVNRLGPDVRLTGERLIDESDRLVRLLDGLPTVLCHHDAVRSNLFTRTVDGVTQTVAIDWESVGPGPAGADLASLLFSSVRRGDLDAALLREIAPAAREAYADELGRVSAEAALASRHGFAASVALRWSLLRDVVRALGTPGGPLARGRRLQEPREVAVRELAALCGFLVDMAAEAGAVVTR